MNKKETEQKTIIPKDFQQRALQEAKKHAVSHEVSDYTRDYIEHAISDNTKYHYQADLNQFQHWCKRYDVDPLLATPTLVANFLAEQAVSGLKVSTVQRRAAELRRFFKEAEIDPLPTNGARVKKTLEGIRKKHKHIANSKRALLLDDIKAIVDFIDLSTLSGLRDRALILTGFAGGFRRSELADLKAEQISFSPQGMVITLLSSKSDQEGRGMKRPILRYADSPYCPVNAMEAWLDQANITDNFVFRRFNNNGTIRPIPLTIDLEPQENKERQQRKDAPALCGQSIGWIVKEYVQRIDLPVEEYGAHSLRSGCITTLLTKGKTLVEVQKFIGHKKPSTTSDYYQNDKLFEEHPAEGLFD